MKTLLLALLIAFCLPSHAHAMDNLKANHSEIVQLVFKDNKGNVTQPASGSSISWSVDAPAKCSIAVASDNLSAVVHPVGPLGVCNVSAHVDPIGIQPELNGTQAINVVPGDAASMSFVTADQI